MVSLQAPPGVTEFSFGGTLYHVDADGMLNLDNDAAVQVARWHGFRSPQDVERSKITDDIRLSRDDAVEMLNHLGVAIADATIPAATIAEALKEAVKAKADAVKRAEDDLRDGAKKAVEEVEAKTSKKRGS